MIMVVGNKKKEIDNKDIEDIINKFSYVVLDLGTGDGRYVYKNAVLNQNTLYIGIDPSEKQLEIYSKKAVRSKLNNAVFIVGSIEKLPISVTNLINKITLNLPWGTLLENVVKPTKDTISKMSNLLKIGGEIDIILGYSQEFEPKETKRLDLPVIGSELIENTINPLFKSCGFNLENYRELSKKELKDIETTWAKKLNFGKDRRIFKISFKKES